MFGRAQQRRIAKSHTVTEAQSETSQQLRIAIQPIMIIAIALYIAIGMIIAILADAIAPYREY